MSRRRQGQSKPVTKSRGGHKQAHKHAQKHAQKASRSRAATGWLHRINWHVMRQTCVGLAWVLAVGGIITAWAMGVPRLQAFASQRANVNQVTVKFVNPPPWFNGELQESLTMTAELQLQSGDPLRRDELLAVKDALLNTRWFDSILQVRRAKMDVVEIEAKFVRPYAVIRDRSGYHLVDDQGKLLPKFWKLTEQPARRDAQTNQKRPIIAITGPRFDRPSLGETWEGSDVFAGLQLLQILDDQPWRDQIKEVDISGYLDDGPIRLRTDIGSVIVWGGAPGEEPALEILAEEKLRRLHFLYQNYQRVDCGQLGEWDITGEKTVVKRELPPKPEKPEASVAPAS